MNDRSLKGDGMATALVTGAASGIGYAVAQRLTQAGWRVTGIDRAPATPTSPALHDHIVADLADHEACARVCRAVAGQRWTALVHAAGVMRSDAHQATWNDGGTELWAVHVAAAARLADTVTPTMTDGAGRIVLVSSRAAQGRAGRMLYAASKSALDGLARSLALDLVARGITVNVVAPGATDTPMLADPDRANATVAVPPIGRLVTAGEIAGTVAFLLGPDAGSITGQTLYQCGGASLASGATLLKRVQSNREDV
ncbi:SDR family NAD(P)-dependent oxidoreductase [Stappia stellulata]|uniref:SDR family NAD(P)-dependent oxidoreductase n=1 Tax=Stappia stellulata TaxID=71235 RepID=UPI000685C6E9|nr:SDR family oxidoreductase [Stappia stellulata]